MEVGVQISSMWYDHSIFQHLKTPSWSLVIFSLCFVNIFQFSGYFVDFFHCDLPTSFPWSQKVITANFNLLSSLWLRTVAESFITRTIFPPSAWLQYYSVLIFYILFEKYGKYPTQTNQKWLILMQKMQIYLSFNAKQNLMFTFM